MIIGNINLLIEIVATYFIIVATFVVVTLVVRDGCVARSRSIPTPLVFILKSTVLPSLLCRTCDDEATKSRVHHERALHLVSVSPGVVVRSLRGLIVVLFLFRSSSPVRIFKFIVHPLSGVL